MVRGQGSGWASSGYPGVTLGGRAVMILCLTALSGKA